MRDSETTIQQLKERTEAFRRARRWGQHHSLKNLAASIAIEAAELLEHFQWDDWVKNRKRTQAGIGQELADIVIYCLYFAQTGEIDISREIEKKLKELEQRYPARLFQKKRGRLSEYYRIKTKHRKLKKLL